MKLHSPEPLESRIAPATFTVSSTADTGAGSFRQAIVDANASPDASDVIGFSFTDYTTISPLSPLPALASGVIIDALVAAPNYNLPHVILDGSLAGVGATGLKIAGDGVSVSGGTSATGTTMKQNFIGTTAAGTGDLGNGGNGVQFASVLGTSSIGGSGVGNIIAGNGLSGILIGTADLLTIQGNTIGLSGSANARGILINGSAGDGVIVGGVSAGQGNNIGFNTGAGVAVAGTANVTIRGNSIRDNGGLGIDLGNNGPTGNDPGDTDPGANGLLNFPAISSVAVTGSSAVVSGTYEGLTDTALTLDFYSNSVNGEAETYLGSTSLNTGPTGIVPFTQTFASVPAGRTISATATKTLSPGQTSEISPLVAQLPALTISDVTAAEGASGATNFTFTVTLGAASASNVTVDFATADGSANAGSDYIATSGTVAFTPGQTSRTVTVAVNGDTSTEFTETFFVNLSNAVGAVLTDAQAIGTITNDDSPFLIIADATIAEGNSGTTNLVFSVSLNSAAASDVTVEFATANDTATAGSDFVTTTGTLTFAAGELTKTITVPLLGDTSIELTETLLLNLSNATGATISDPQAVGTITNDDFPALTIGDVTVVEGNAGITNAVFTVSVSASAPFPITVDFSTANDTAIAGSDFVATTGTLVFAAGQTQRTIAVPLIGDLSPEFSETFFLNLSNAIGATIIDAQGLATMSNDDYPALAISDLTQLEGTGGATQFAFTVTMSEPAPYPVSVNYRPFAGTASASDDFVDQTATLTIPAGEVSGLVIIEVFGDDTTERTENFTVQLTNPVGAFITDFVAIGTILNDDTTAVNVQSVSVTERNSGSHTAIFSITLSGPSDNQITFDIATRDGTATAGSDYVAASGSFTLFPGERSVATGIEILTDRLFSDDETFFYEITNIVGAANTSTSGVITILNDDAPVSLTVSDVTTLESGEQTIVPFEFTVQLSGALESGITIPFSTTNGTALAGSDYESTAGSLSLAAGETSATVTVIVNGDIQLEPTETFELTLGTIVGAPSSMIIDRAGTGTITNDDFLVSVAGGSFAESGNYEITLSLLGSPSTKITVNYVTRSGTAMAGADFTSASGSVIFNVGETSKVVVLPLLGESIPEGDEQFFVDITSAVAQIGTNTAEITILDDDAPTISLISANPLLNLEDSADDAGRFPFVVFLSKASTVPITVRIKTAQGSATADDFSPLDRIITFAPGSTVFESEVVITADLFAERDETFTLSLSESTNAVIDSDSTLDFTIRDNDGLTISKNKKTATWRDLDGDLVTLKVTKPVLTPAMFTFRYGTPIGAASKIAGQLLESFDLTSAFFTAEKTGISIKAKRKDGLGDGQVNVGAINATGMNLGAVSVSGDLGRINAGHQVNGTGIKSLTLRSLGDFGTTTQSAGGNLVSTIKGNLGKLKIAGNVSDAALRIAGNLFTDGNLGNVSIGGSLRGGDGDGIFASGRIGKISITRDISGISPLDSVSITAAGKRLPTTSTMIAIAGLTVGGLVANAEILAGYSIDGAALNPNVSIGDVKVKQTWTASTLAAGIARGNDGLFGTGDDKGISVAAASLVARIASITIGGEVNGTASAGDHFGFVANAFGGVKINGSKLPFTIALDAIEVGTSGDVTVREIAPERPPIRADHLIR